MARDPDAPTLICLTTCRSRYGLNDGDLSALDFIACRNPHYRSAAPMRLYVEDDVRELAREKERLRAERTQYLLDHADEITAERKDRVAAEARARRDGSKAFVERFYAFGDPCEHHSTPGNVLPIDLLGRVMVMVARSLEPDGIRGPGIVAMDLLNAAMAFADMRAAVADGFAELGRLCPGIGFGFDYRDPMATTLRSLLDAARVLDLKTTGTKPELAHRILEELRLEVPPLKCVPLSVVRAVSQERKQSRLPTGLRCAALQAPESNTVLTVAGGRANVMGLRAARLCLATRWADMREFDAEPRRVHAEPPVLSTGGNNCACGNAAAGACSKGMCGTCCGRAPGRCGRHRVA